MYHSVRHLLLLPLLVFASSFAFAERPRLILQITVDGFRADLINRYAENFGENGFNYLLRNGTHFTNAHYQHANTETIVGHTTLATGATPAVHGMVGNVWYHADNGELGYNIEDDSSPLLPTRSANIAGAQVDPAQLRAGSTGRSPRAILAPTFGDTLSVSGGGNAKVFGVSGKDRSAVAMAGKSGTAYWYSTDSGDFQTSTYYMDEYPQWVVNWNAQRQAEKLSDKNWALTMPRDRYLFGASDDRPYEVDLKGYGITFPHAFGPAEHPLFYTRVLVSAHGDRLLGDFAKTLIDAEGIGQDDDTDYLSVSFSSVDAVNHFFGPSSLENEVTVIDLDRTLAELLAHVDERVGLDRTIVVLSADHGMAEMPEYSSERGMPAGRLYSNIILKAARELSMAVFEKDLVKDFFRPYVYLDTSAIEAAGLDTVDVASVLAKELQTVDGVRRAIPSATAATNGELAVGHNHHDERSGQIYVYQQPHWFFFDRGAIGVMHGSPWAYDQHVPIIFAGSGIPRSINARLVHPADVAPTLSALLGLPPPAAAEGTVLGEVLSR
jgi:predicted AlkP superfamily pyrophosphatase or phosphodiesterase